MWEGHWWGLFCVQEQQVINCSKTNGLFWDSTISLKSKNILIIPDWLCYLSVSMYFRFIKQRFWFLFSDNIFSIKSWTKKKFAFDDSRINKAFGIPEDFDYMDWLPAFLQVFTLTIRGKCVYELQFEGSIPGLSTSSLCVWKWKWMHQDSYLWPAMAIK